MPAPWCDADRPTMPLPGELNATTIQNATIALGAIKALLYADDIQRRARVVGIHYPFATEDPAIGAEPLGSDGSGRARSGGQGFHSLNIPAWDTSPARVLLAS